MAKFFMYLDDIRNPSWTYPTEDSSQWHVCRSVAQAQQLIQSQGCPNWISFDHDLGDGELTGYDFARWLVEQDLNIAGTFLPENFSFAVHSANPVGAANIKGLLDNYLRTRP